MKTTSKRGITLMEVLAVISIIGMLMALLLPAVQNTRETARRAQCASNIRQQCLAMSQHVSACGFFPSSGWSGAWVGDPDRAAGRSQPGGWIYSSLAYVERRDLREMGHGLTRDRREASMASVLQQPLSIFNCPTRRRPAAYTITYQPAITPRGTKEVALAARADYAANAGGQARCEIYKFWGPKTLEAGDDPNYKWPNTSDHNGISYLRSEVAPAMISDGMSHTYLIGEKYLAAAYYENGADHSDDWSMYSGYQNDICRTAFDPPLMDGGLIDNCCNFGSAHPAGWNMGMCDGSVRSLSYDIDPAIHRYLGNRRDRHPIDDSLVR